MDGKTVFKGQLAMKVKRANPTWWQRLLDILRGIV